MNVRGEKVLDTMIKVEDPMMIMVKPGKKQAIVEAMAKCGPSVSEVSAKVLEIIKGKRIVGYGLKAKLKDLGIEDRVEPETTLSMVNVSTMFNQDTKKDP